MSAITTIHPAGAQQPTEHSTLRRLVARHPVTAFLVMAFVFGWTALVPLLLSKDGFAVLPIELPVTVFQFVASVVGLALPAFLVTAATDGKPGVRNLLRRCLRWRVGVQWYLIALFVTLVAVVVLALPFFGVLPLQMAARKWSLLFTVFLPGVFVPFLHTNLPEEIGWTSLQARLQDRHGPVLATIIVTPVFALLHLPAFFVDGWISTEKTPLAQFPSVLLIVGVLAVLGIFLRLIIMWLYNGSGHSLLIVALFHSAYNMTNQQQFISELVSGREASWLPTLAVVVVAGIVAAFTRGRFAYRPAPA